MAACGSEREGFSSTNNGNQPPEGVFGDEDGNGTPDGDFGKPGAGDGDTQDPVDCASAARLKSYVGCDYWPTITPNVVWSIFDYAVVVANTGPHEAAITVTGPNGTNKTATVPSGQLRKIYLPWVPALKGGDADACGAPPDLEGSVIVNEGAYHLVSSSPVTVYQFNALEYTGEGGEDESGGPKDWSECPGTVRMCGKIKIGCFSFSNDASLLLPSTAMTNTYRVMGYKGASAAPWAGAPGLVATVLSVTSTQPNTSVTVALSPTAKVVASQNGQVAATEGGSTLTFDLPNAGDVLELVSEKGQEYDFSGSLVQSTKPVQVITSTPCINIPSDKQACDHLEETVLPAETLGKHYVVTPPTGPKGEPVGHVVRLYGNKDGTTLEYKPTKPEKCPDTLGAGQVADCEIVAEDQAFEVTGSQEFGVATFLLGARHYDWSGMDKRGDPDQSYYPSVEQFRTKYVFLGPNDYPVLYADITAPAETEIVLDDAPLEATWTAIGDGRFGVHRVDLTKSGRDGVHTLTASKPVGVQVIGFGDNTSFQYPGGLNLTLIAAPPPK
ncbi:MAG TPA: IgGFc-binding protein [Labilithrix sp.]|nr:IgGFc-binding protein [Labilithrix sp.]